MSNAITTMLASKAARQELNNLRLSITDKIPCADASQPLYSRFSEKEHAMWITYHKLYLQCYDKDISLIHLNENQSCLENQSNHINKYNFHELSYYPDIIQLNMPSLNNPPKEIISHSFPTTEDCLCVETRKKIKYVKFFALFVVCVILFVS